MDAVGSGAAEVERAPKPGDEFSVLEAAPVKELTEAQQVAALTAGLGLDDPNLADGHGLTGFGAGEGDAGVAVSSSGPAPHEFQPTMVQTEDLKDFGRGDRPAPTQVQIKGGAKPTGHGQPIPPGALVGRPGMQPPAVVGRPGVQGASAPAPVVGLPERAIRMIEKPMGMRPDGTVTMGQVPGLQLAPTAAPESPIAPAYPKHPGESIPDPAFTLTQGQLNTIRRLMDAAINSPADLISAIAAKVSVKVAGVEDVTIEFTAAELAEIDRRATFLGQSRAEATQQMFDQVKSYMFESSSM